MKGLKIAGAILAELFGLGCLLKIAFAMSSVRAHAPAPGGLVGYAVGFAAATAVSFFLIWSALSTKFRPPTSGTG